MQRNVSWNQAELSGVKKKSNGNSYIVCWMIMMTWNLVVTHFSMWSMFVEHHHKDGERGKLCVGGQVIDSALSLMNHHKRSSSAWHFFPSIFLFIKSFN